jgi:ribulose-phosphate 3-epimerase
VRRLRAMIDARNPRCLLEVDGGIKASNITRVVEAGADTIVVGSAIYNDDEAVHDAVLALRSAIG